MDAGPLVVQLVDLRLALDRVLGDVEAQLGPVVELGADHRWLIGSDAAFDLTQLPDVAAGQLSDDVETLCQVRDGRQVVAWHDLDHALGVLQRLSALTRP